VELINFFTPSWIAKAFIIPIALSPSYLTYSLTRDFLLYVIEKLANVYFGKNVQTTGNRYFPVTRKVFLSTAVVLSLLSASIDYTTAKEIYPEDNALHWIAVIASIINSLALTLLPMIELSEIMLNLSARCFQNPEINLKLDTSQKVSQLQFYIKRCSDEEAKFFILDLCKNEFLKNDLILAFPWIKQEIDEMRENQTKISPSTEFSNTIYDSFSYLLKSSNSGLPSLDGYSHS
jgi:hypothetical protein